MKKIQILYLATVQLLIWNAILVPKSYATETIYTVSNGDNLTRILIKAGVDKRETFLAGKALQKIYNPKSLKKGQEITVVLSDKEDHEFLSLSIDEPLTEVKLFKKKGRIFAKRVPKKLRVLLKRKKGTIKTSLYNLASSIKIPMSVFSDAINIYSFDVDFQREIKRGSRFEILYEELFDARHKVGNGNILYASLTVNGKDLRIYRFSPSDKKSKYNDTDYFTESGRTLRRSLLKTPIDGAVISSPFGRRKHPIMGYSRLHKGVDFAAPSGTPFYAAGDGIITYIGKNKGYGNYIRIKHNMIYSTAYGHIKKFAKGLRKWSRVRQGQIIAYVGSTGASTGPHLHYEILKHEKQINPMKVDLPPGRKLNKNEMIGFERKKNALQKLLHSG